MQNSPARVRIAPENLDFDYTVQGTPNSVLRVMSDGTQTLVVLPEPLPSEITFVPINIANQPLRATVHGNTVLVPGVPQAFSVLLPVGLVNVTRVSSGPNSMPSDPKASQAKSIDPPAMSAGSDVSPDTNWDWEGSSAVTRSAGSSTQPQIIWGLPKTFQTVPGGPLPGAIPADIPPGMPTSIDINENTE